MTDRSQSPRPPQAPADKGRGVRYAIAELAEEFGVTARTLRFYEDAGLLAPVRLDGGARLYSRRDRARLIWVLRAKRVGFSLSEIREMIDLYDMEDGRARQRAFTLGKCREKVSQLEQQRVEIDGAIGELAAFITLLESAERQEDSRPAE